MHLQARRTCVVSQGMTKQGLKLYRCTSRRRAVNPPQPKAPQEMNESIKKCVVPLRSSSDDASTSSKRSPNRSRRSFSCDISTHAQQVNNLYLPQTVATEEQEGCTRSLCFISPLKLQRGDREQPKVWKEMRRRDTSEHLFVLVDI